MNRCWALFLPLCCYLRLVSAEVSCDGGRGWILPSPPQPPCLATPSSPCSELWSPAAREPGSGHWVAPRAGRPGPRLWALRGGSGGFLFPVDQPRSLTILVSWKGVCCPALLSPFPDRGEGMGWYLGCLRHRVLLNPPWNQSGLWFYPGSGLP